MPVGLARTFPFRDKALVLHIIQDSLHKLSLVTHRS
jgi:hypothetical protein